MTERQKQVLKQLVEEYINSAEPVSSKLLTNQGKFKLSSATLRAEMQSLEEAGYLHQPHTSSGRVPTDKAYRFYVDNFLRVGDSNLRPEAKKRISGDLADAMSDPEKMIKCLADALSSLSSSVVITAIKEQQDFFKRGLAPLFQHPEFQFADAMSRMAKFFDEFESMFDRMEREFFGVPDDIEIRIAIGRENHIRDMQDQTLMTAGYDLPGRLRGLLVLVGPMRMDYEKNINLLTYAVNELKKYSKYG
ncbi:MAG: hypothetical protein CEN90_146 [Parcubacteria group bacterium Licking1014_17]|nr:MAG: hypothetical protein CEN90_146 [Parcubacteria group bacterium Licking1014_17]